jgi:hypothetical protein
MTHTAAGAAARTGTAVAFGAAARTGTAVAFGAAALLMAGLFHPPLQAQQVGGLLPDSVAHRAVAFYNLEPTTRLLGDARIGPGTGMRGAVAVLAGTLTVEGNLEGDVVIINGSLDVRANGRIGGHATVIGGDARVAPGASVTGGVQVYREPLRYRHAEGRIVYVPPEQERGLAAGIDLPFGRTDMLVAAHGAYNRVEGLAMAVGPRLRFGGAYPTSARAQLIVRTAAASELDPHRFGYLFAADQLVVPRIGLTVGLQLRSEIVPIEDWGLSDREAALAAFVLHRDYRDHYEREGWAAVARLRPPGARYALELSYRDEEHASRPVADPITILDSSAPWRPQPAIAEGALRSITAAALYDSRNEDRDPSAGWLVNARVEQGLGGGLTNPAAPADAGDGTAGRAARSGFLTTQVDVRRYARLSPYSRIALRAVAAGSLDARPLPPQRQHALGGEGSLPGYRLFEFDCGARLSTEQLRGETVVPYYGCDRLAMVQLEYQANFPFARRIAEAAGVGAAVGNLVRWVVFFDAGRAWNEPGSADGRPGGNDDFSADAGLGLRVGPLGAYWATPLSGRGQGFNFFVRLGPRI